MCSIIHESISSVGSNEVVIECNKNDAELVKKILSEQQGMNPKVKTRISDQYIDVLGGIRVRSADGTMTYDNTIDSRIDRLKPLIRKNISQMLRGDA